LQPLNFLNAISNDRFLPDKAIDLLDEAASLKRLRTKGNNDKIRALQKDLAKVIKEKEESVSKQNYEHAAALRDKELKLSEGNRKQPFYQDPARAEAGSGGR